MSCFFSLPFPRHSSLVSHSAWAQCDRLQPGSLFACAIPVQFIADSHAVSVETSSSVISPAWLGMTRGCSFPYYHVEFHAGSYGIK